MTNDILINFGGAIKTLESKGDLVTVGDYGVLWGDHTTPDLAGDWFTKDTLFGARKGLGVDTMLHHGMPLSKELAGYAGILLPPTVKAEADEHGLLVATVLDRKDAYQRRIYELCEKGALSWSSGANPRAVRRENGAMAGKITQWPIMEFSFTPTPCEPRMSGVMELKAMLDFNTETPTYTKAVRVLSDLKSAEKSTVFTRDGGSIAASVIRESADRLIYGVIYDVFLPTSPPTVFGLAEFTTPTTEEKLNYLKETLGDFGEFVYSLCEKILLMQGEQSPEEAAKALKDELLNLKADLPDELSFVDHSEKVLAANEGFTFRTKGLISLRESSRKSGRVLSKANLERLTKYHSSLKEITSEVEELLSQHTESSGEQGGNEATETEAKTIELEQELLALELATMEI